MIHLRRRIVSLLLKPVSHVPDAVVISPLIYLRRAVSTTAPASPKPFAVEEYLVATCGLTRAQAAKASGKLSHLRSPSRPDAVLAFLSDLGVSRPDVAAAVAADPGLLCAGVEKNLARRAAELGDLGISRSQIARLVPLANSTFRSRALATNLGFWLPVLGSFEKILKCLKMNSSILGSDLEKVVKPNLALLEECGMTACDIASCPSVYSRRLLTLNPSYLRDAVARAEELGLGRGSRMFRYALMAVALTSKESVAAKLRVLDELGFSRDDVLLIVRKSPQFLALSEKKIRRAAEFFKRDIGLEERYIAQRPALFTYSLERRLLPRHYLLKVLRAKGLLNCELDYYRTAAMGEEKFVQRFVDPYKDHIPGLAEAYASRCFEKVN
ncbi:transcription termination factor MTEF1, chloroplastic-like [Oryza brachyantha]|uniref:transcription termination factor MTEF1, chloroplastic-like n=1 Tax=Oryza brachyantha TaxID=4533 RepID=UPI001ADD4664|nr:transcription termination factor MTEF1, chloroplastic-like [Oryza brachyantha]